jgi:hypothetical protein
MSVMLVRQNVKDGSIEDAEAAVRELFTTLDRVRPEACATRRRGWWTALRS